MIIEYSLSDHHFVAYGKLRSNYAQVPSSSFLSILLMTVKLSLLINHRHELGHVKLTRLLCVGILRIYHCLLLGPILLHIFT